MTTPHDPLPRLADLARREPAKVVDVTDRVLDTLRTAVPTSPPATMIVDLPVLWLSVLAAALAAVVLSLLSADADDALLPLAGPLLWRQL